MGQRESKKGENRWRKRPGDDEMGKREVGEEKREGVNEE